MLTFLNYRLRACYDAGDWSGMVAAVADHFRLPAPDDVMLRSSGSRWRWICIYCNNTAYCYYADGSASASPARVQEPYAVIG
jgi:hypothetical protein